MRNILKFKLWLNKLWPSVSREFGTVFRRNEGQLGTDKKSLQAMLQSNAK